jgi:hypothetical protein
MQIGEILKAIVWPRNEEMNVYKDCLELEVDETTKLAVKVKNNETDYSVLQFRDENET